MNIIHGDCVEAMQGMDAESVDAICTDPPYGLEFMGKAWDRLGDVGKTSHSGPADRDPSTPYGRTRVAFSGSSNVKCRNCGKWQWGHKDGDRGGGGKGCQCDRPDFPSVKAHQGRLMQSWHDRWAEAAYRVAKPSSYLLAFGGTRTVHRMAVAIEDAGWIIRDMLVWAYASGFPKSKASLKPAWEPIVMARKPGPLRMLAIDSCRIGLPEDKRAAGTRTYAAGKLAGGMNGDGTLQDAPHDGLGRWPANVILTDPIFDGDVDGVVGGGETSSGTKLLTHARNVAKIGDGVAYEGGTLGGGDDYPGDSGTYSRFFVLPKADRQDREPVLDEYAYRLHRERGECDKLRTWASADLNRSDPTGSTSPERATSEATSTGDSSSDTLPHGSRPTDPSLTAIRSTTSTATRPTTDSTTSSSSIPSPTNGSTPAANFETASGGSPAESADGSSLWAPPTGISVPRAGRSTDDADPATSGSSSRRSVCGRCGKPLPRVGSHPTVKPTELMRHLVRLVTPQGGTVLDPFLGSGTTGIACELEGFPWIGVEKELEYVRIAEARLNGTQRGLGLSV